LIVYIDFCLTDGSQHYLLIEAKRPCNLNVELMGLIPLRTLKTIYELLYLNC